MEFFICIDPMFQGTYWCNQYVKGIRFEAAQNSKAIGELSPEAVECSAAPSAICQEGDIVMLLGATSQWLNRAAGALGIMGARPVMISPFLDLALPGVSAVYADYHALMYSLCDYMDIYGHTRTALFGWLPDSATDMVKRRAFEHFMGDHGRQDFQVIENRQNLGQACAHFYAQWEKFDSVICCNDVAAIKLLTYLKERGVAVPGLLWMATIGDTILARMTQPGITTAMLDCIAIGRQAVKVCMLLAKTSILTTLRATVSGAIDVRETTHNAPYNRKNLTGIALAGGQDVGMDFYADTSVKDIFNLEALLGHVTASDVAILRGIRDGLHYDQLSEKLFLSESAIKYKLRRMCALAGEDKRENVITLIERYLDFDQLVGMYENS